MTTFLTLASTARDQDSPVDQTLVDALYLNPLAIAEGDATAPVNQWGWHPYNKVTNGDANNGLLYDFSVNGAVASVIAPNFADGYEYRFFLDGLSSTGSSALYFEPSDAAGTYSSLLQCTILSTTSGVLFYSGWIDIYTPRVNRKAHLVQSMVENDASGTRAISTVAFLCSTGAAIVHQAARIRFNGTNIINGRIYMWKRRAPA